MKDRKTSSGRQQGDIGRQGQWQQSQDSSGDNRQHKGSGKLQHKQQSAHRSQQR